MFSNGKFKNVVALVSSQEGCPVGPGSTLKKTYTLRPIKGSTKNWIALEDSYMKTGATLASTVVCPGNGPDDRNVFAIYVSYYVKVTIHKMTDNSEDECSRKSSISDAQKIKWIIAEKIYETHLLADS